MSVKTKKHGRKTDNESAQVEDSAGVAREIVAVRTIIQKLLDHLGAMDIEEGSRQKIITSCNIVTGACRPDDAPLKTEGASGFDVARETAVLQRQELPGEAVTIPALSLARVLAGQGEVATKYAEQLEHACRALRQAAEAEERRARPQDEEKTPCALDGHEEAENVDVADISALLPLVKQVGTRVKNLGLRGKGKAAAQRRCEIILGGETTSEDQISAADELAALLKKGSAKAKDFADDIVDCLQLKLPGVGEPETEAGDTPQTDAADIPLALLDISRWNRAYGQKPDEAYQKRLRGSIQQHGLLHPVVLVRDKQDEERPFKVLAGANRVAALLSGRPDNQLLHPHEYRLLDDLTEDDPKCLAVSLAENSDRRESSPYELAFYVQRLIAEQGVTENELAKALKTHRSTISRLVSLTKCFDRLPDSWKKDLSAVPECDSNHTPAITLSHFAKVAPKLGKTGPSKNLVELMERAHAERWPVARLDQELRALAAPKKAKAEPDRGPEDADTVPRRQDVSDRGAKAAPVVSSLPVDPSTELHNHLTAALELARQYSPDLVDMIADIISMLDERVEDGAAREVA